MAMFLLFVTRPAGAGYNPVALSGHKKNIVSCCLNNYKIDSYGHCLLVSIN
jgi:hypothetical protein